RMRKFRFIAPVIAGMLVLAACTSDEGSPDGSGGGGDGGAAEEGDGSITVTSLWGGTEQEAFEAVLAAFTEETGIEATYEPNRTDYATVLRTRIQGGNPPDVAIIPGIGTLRSLARDGSLISIADLGLDQSSFEGNYAPGILDIGEVDGELFAIMVKLNSKSAIWYDPARFEELGVSADAADFDDLVALTDDIKGAGATPWALGAGDSWTLTDNFEAIYLKMNGVEAFDTLFGPDGDFTDPTVQAAIDKMLELYTDDNVDGGIDGSLSTLFVDAIAKVFGTSPSAELYCCGGFIGGIATGTDVNPDLQGQEGTAIDWFPFPTVDGNGEGLVNYGGDVMAALVNDSDVAAFMEYLTTPEAGQVWAEGGTIISPLLEVDTSVYPTELIQKEAEQINSAEAVRFDGADLLPGTDFGAALQSALRGEDMGPILEEFQNQTQTAWEQE
ncbi:MAG TPA: ABC transporter substrate-binding protein, partial [Candidatus Limnocylindria bacterium]|nr:ABC transporter substrate-binding protein [Candidatus Limnocylindria bacterium]